MINSSQRFELRRWRLISSTHAVEYCGSIWMSQKITSEVIFKPDFMNITWIRFSKRLHKLELPKQNSAKTFMQIFPFSGRPLYFCNKLLQLCAIFFTAITSILYFSKQKAFWTWVYNYFKHELWFQDKYHGDRIIAQVNWTWRCIII